jgi:hypothetical protein
MTQEISTRTIQVEVEKRYKLRPWKKHMVMAQWREIIVEPWEFEGTVLPLTFKWNGSSSPWWARSVISPWENPKASGYHDKRCAEAITMMNLYKELKDQYPALANTYKRTALTIRKEADEGYGRLVGNSKGKAIGKIGEWSTNLGSIFGAGWK